MIEILYGIADGALLQRGEDDTCDITLGLKAPGTVLADLGNLSELPMRDGVREFSLRGIPVGGPYTLTLTSGFDRLVIRNLYVGDLWMLAGQSNMAGFARHNDETLDTLRDEGLRCLYLCDKWFPAHPATHADWRADTYMFSHIEHGKIVRPPYPPAGGVGPGYYLLGHLRDYTGVPQGAIACAVGGTGLDAWAPYSKFDDRERLYGNMLYRFRMAGSHVRGMFWYQGCTDAMCKAHERFTRLMHEFIDAVRRDFRDPKLPIVQYQLFNFQAEENPDVMDSFSSIREQQRRLCETVPYLTTVSTQGSVTDDAIHLTALSHKRLAPMAAECMAQLCFDPEGKHTMLAPAIEHISCHREGPNRDRVIEVKFRNLRGDLTCSGVPSGFALSRSPKRVDTHLAFKCYLRGDTAVVRHLASDEELPSLYLWYGYGTDTYTNISDSADRPIPAFGPISLADKID